MSAPPSLIIRPHSAAGDALLHEGEDALLFQGGVLDDQKKHAIKGISQRAAGVGVGVLAPGGHGLGDFRVYSADSRMLLLHHMNDPGG